MVFEEPDTLHSSEAPLNETRRGPQRALSPRELSILSRAEHNVRRRSDSSMKVVSDDLHFSRCSLSFKGNYRVLFSAQSATASFQSL